MIPAFLRSLSAQVRARIKDETAMHVTEDTARELDWLAGLPWTECADVQACPRCKGKGHEGGPFPEGRLCTFCGGHARIGWRIQPADLALGWLIGSRLTADGEGYDQRGMYITPADCLRAAQCAELAVMACHATWSHGGYWHTIVDNLPACGPASSGIYAGTKEGARACWGFVSDNLGRLGRIHKTVAAENVRAFEPVGVYRRELEAMK